jgi:MraZ protein
MLTGEYRISIDDKGRILIPARLRADIPGNSLVVTRGIDECLWLMLPEQWRKFSDSLKAISPFQAKARLLQRRFLAPSQEIELDKAGRINIPMALAEAAGLGKECMILGIGAYMEIWDVNAHQASLSTSEQIEQAVEELGGSINFF